MGKIAFVFSGQGAQYTGMGRELYECSPAAKAVFDMADSIREGTSNQCFEADKETLSITVNTQPCVFTADLAAAAAVAEKGIRPDYLAGFSLGEIAALGFGGVMSYEEAFRLDAETRRAVVDQLVDKVEELRFLLKRIPEREDELAAADPFPRVGGFDERRRGHRPVEPALTGKHTKPFERIERQRFSYCRRH